jgi:CDP-paratose 2-epimerase
MKINGNIPSGPVLVTGGAGFIGSNLANRLLSEGKKVVIYDNLTRPGVEKNLKWLTGPHGSAVRFIRNDVRNAEALNDAVANVSAVFHLAAQVAVTTSLDNPIDDFEINARGTLNVLEAVRRTGRKVPLLFTSTNKVYGELGGLALEAEEERYISSGKAAFNENLPLSFHSPYGSSKGAADQYVLDYGRTFGIPSVVFRMSCIYGPRQFGTEDQGWVAHFLLQTLRGKPITLYGDGKQVRDVLFVDDLIDGMLMAMENIAHTHGLAFNMGGGERRTISLLELIGLIENLTGIKPEIRKEPWRAADQKYYVSDTTRFHELTGWQPSVEVSDGVERLLRWLSEQRESKSRLGATVTSAS